MHISYRHNPHHLDLCEQVIREHKAELLAGETIEMTWPERSAGYPGQITVRILKDDAESFWSEKDFNDPSRFPARIRTAAKALFTQGCYGDFEIYHEAGHLTIRVL
jgi:hypothetical protein